MSTILIILIIVFGVVPLLRYAWRRWVQPWLIRRAQNKMEDYIRAATGMPPREKNTRKSSGGKKTTSQSSSGGRSSSSAYSGQPHTGPMIPKEYAVDVEFVEIKEYSSTTVITGEPSDRRSRSGSQSVRVESQVSDVEYTEIRVSEG